MTDPQTKRPPLAALGRVVLEDAKAFRTRGRRLQYWILAVGLLAVVIQATPQLIDSAQQIKWLVPLTKTVAYACAVVGLTLQSARWWWQRKAVDTHSRGSAIKRRALLIDSLGPSDEQLDIRMLRESAGSDAEARAQSYSMPNPYYASSKPVGLGRLRENLQESAFFSHRLYDKAATREFESFGLTLACIVVGLVALATLAPREIGAVIANCALAFLSFLVSADQLGRAMSWRQAAIAVERVERRLDSITGNDAQPYIAAFADYEAATATAPSVPTALYSSERARLDALWRDRSGQ